MGHSRASKEEMKRGGSMPRKKYSEGDSVDHFSLDKKISTKKLDKATHAENPLLKKRANVDVRYRGD